MDELATRDHPDWWQNVGGSNAQDSTLERRSLIWNDNEVVAPAAPPFALTPGTYFGKFFPRGCRGMIEQLQLYCNGNGVDELTLVCSPHPGIGPILEGTIAPAAGWAWQNFDIEEMWDYDSLFVYIRVSTANIQWGYDTAEPYDSHRSPNFGATWLDLAQRMFIRVVFTGETPGDVPVSGILNIIPIPSGSTEVSEEDVDIPTPGLTTIIDIHGAGYCDYIEAEVDAGANSDDTLIGVYCDEIFAGNWQFLYLNTHGHTTSTPTISLSSFAADGMCYMLIHKRFEFRRRLRITAQNLVAVATVTVRAYPTLLR